jgi:hypothetical protein
MFISDSVFSQKSKNFKLERLKDTTFYYTDEAHSIRLSHDTTNHATHRVRYLNEQVVDTIWSNIFTYEHNPKKDYWTYTREKKTTPTSAIASIYFASIYKDSIYLEISEVSAMKAQEMWIFIYDSGAWHLKNRKIIGRTDYLGQRSKYLLPSSYKSIQVLSYDKVIVTSHDKTKTVFGYDPETGKITETRTEIKE